MSTQSVNLDDAEISAIVTSRKSVVDCHIQNFLSNRNNVRKVIGLDVELTMIEDDSEETEDWHRGKNSKRAVNQHTEETKEEDSKMKSQVAILQLCDGDESLIVQLALLDSMPNSLLNFLQIPDFSFVGVGIKDCVAKLERDYGLGCKNAVDLGKLAASVMQMPHLAACGLDLLGHTIAPMKLDKPSSVVFSDWGKVTLNKKQIKFAATNCFAYFKIGNKLLWG
ncbi:hypothetical protein COLO4_23200 [Corchorus olitorius]|uniref:3'-5' exonuclease domain-containing protein n=1 Tax=Corchorus olitorius TaxID=93759 RepID=A0A1R3IHU9_9ROSI|nr:hypothetical protein COLO4_23200 [Corchorus olitorius]